MVSCKKCGTDLEAAYIGHVHHLIPKEWGGTDIDGRVWLCGERTKNKCHINLTKLLRQEFANRGWNKQFPPTLEEKQEIKDFQLCWFEKK